MRSIISYIRVSTGKQGKSGLGIEAQREAIARFASAEGLEVLTEFVEVETGKGSDALDRRPKLAEALAKAKRAKASVVVAKLCRLSRDVAFISGLMDAFAFNVLPIVRQIQAAGPTTNRAIAQALNDRGIRTARGGDWHDSTVRNLLARAR
jgi:Resolvase, N terminal domain/Recombinase